MDATAAAATATAAAVEDTIARLEKRKGIEGILVVGRDGKVIRSTVPEALAAKYALLLTKLVQSARAAVLDLDDKDELALLRLRSKKHDFVIAPERDYVLVLIQNPSAVAADGT